MARLVHPFPSLLDGAVVVLIALVAGGAPRTALLLGMSMTLIQFGIGALNDIMDARRDAVAKPDKPIPAGLVSLPDARMIAAAAASIGLVMSAAGGLALVCLAALCLAIGIWYDVRAKGTTLSWLPLAVGIPLLPVFGWLGATGELPGIFLVLVPAAANAGTALAIANSIVDVELDEASGVESIATALGVRRAAWLALALQGVVAVLAVSTALVVGTPAGWLAAVVAASLLPLIGGAGGVLAATRDPAWRELAWDIQAVGAGLLAVAWLGALSASAGSPLGG